MKIFGKVLDTNNDSMSFANITIVTGDFAKKMGTQSDLDGNFVLEDEAIDSNSQFKISYIGYVPQLHKTSELQGQKIKLADNVEVLQEVIIKAGKRPYHASSKPIVVNSTKQKFIQHLNDHKFVYVGIGGLAGILLIVKAFKR